MNHYVLFPSTRVFLSALSFLEEAGLSLRVISLPDRLSDHCGMALEVGENELEEVCSLLEGRYIFQIKQ